MSVINKGTSFSNGEQLTAKKINDMVDLATFDQSATDSASTTVNSASQIIVRDGGITAAKLATDSVETVKILDSTSKTDGVTLPKIQFIDTAKILGRTTAGAGNVEEVGVVIGGSGDAGLLFDNDDMLNNSNTAGGSATRGATQQSIKAYVDSAPGFTPTASDTKSVTLPNGLIMKFGRVDVNGNGTNTIVNFSNFGGNFPNACFSVVLTEERNGGETNGTRLASQPTTDSFETENHLNGSTPINFIAIGR